jgi:hypothetical protein
LELGHPGPHEYGNIANATANALIAHLRDALAAQPAQEAQPVAWISDDTIRRHTLEAKDCPPNSEVMLVSSLRRLQPETLREAEETIRQLIRALREEVDSPTFMGEPVLPAAQPARALPEEYGETEFGYTFAGIQLTDGDRRLMSLLVRAFGTDHPAVADLTELLFRAPAAQPAQEPTEFLGLPFNEAKARILDMDADAARALAISLMIQLGLRDKYAAQPAQAPALHGRLRDAAAAAMEAEFQDAQPLPDENPYGLVRRLRECLPRLGDEPDHKTWCTVLGSDLREAVEKLAAQPAQEPVALTDPLHDDAYVRAIALGFPAGDMRRWALCRIADRIEAAAQPAQEAQPVQSLSMQMQQMCSDWGTYWRASDAHGVDLTKEQALELLRFALGVEVAIAAQPAKELTKAQIAEAMLAVDGACCKATPRWSTTSPAPSSAHTGSGRSDMAFVYKPPPDAEKILRDLAELIAHSYKLKITITIDGPSRGETSTTVIDRLRRLNEVPDRVCNDGDGRMDAI